jgi:DNA-binding PadR family transcriptional regulator
MFIETQVTLADGRRVKAYYLDEEGFKTVQRILEAVEHTNSRFEYTYNMINSMQDELIREFFVPLVTEKILKTLKKNPNQAQREVAEKVLPKDFAKNRLIHCAFYDAWKTLEKNSIIIPESHGRGHARTWRLNK